MREAFRWKALFGFFIVRTAVWYVVVFGSIFIFQLRYLDNLPVGSSIVFFALPLVVLIDLRHRVSRDWLHWLGVAIIFIFAVLSVVQFLAFKLLR